MGEDKWQGQNPWMGLAPYSEGTTLYGRNEECIILSEIIKNNIVSVVFGKSGIGKSSLLSAGISPQLRNENYIPIRIRLVHNTDTSYANQIKKAVKDVVRCDDQLHTSLPEFGLWDFFHRNVFYSAGGEKCVPVIILDQFEEIYTLTDSNHKAYIVDFFLELSYLLNDIKPDVVSEYEQTIESSSNEDKEQHVSKKVLVLKRSKGNSIKYIEDKDYRLVICLREDKLYLLERNSVNIPSLKNNRYNLRALSPQSAFEVIMCPHPNLFSNDEAFTIVDKIADVGEEGIRTIDPAILSLFLYKYFEKKGATNYDNIFVEYYRESTKDVKAKSIAFLENHLLTLGGYRNQIPLDDALSSGVSPTDIQKLLERVILRIEKRKDIDYIEFSHDRLCDEAKMSRDERCIKINRKKLYYKILLSTFISICFISFIYIGYYNNVISNNNIQLNNCKDSLIKVNDNYYTLFKMYKSRGDSLIVRNIEINNTKDSLSLLSEDIFRLLSLSEVQRNKIARSLEIEKISNLRIASQNDSIRFANAKIKEINDSLDKVNIRRNKQINDRLVFDEVVRLFCSLREAYGSRDTQLLSKINEELKKYEVSYIQGIDCISNDEPSLEGHLIFDTEYIDYLIQSIPAANFEKYYKQYKSVRGAVDATAICTKTFAVRAYGKTRLKYCDYGGWSEFAIITEPGGLVNVVIRNKTLGTTRELNENTGKGSPLCQFPQIYEEGKFNEVEIDVINCTDKDISFVVVSSW